MKEFAYPLGLIDSRRPESEISCFFLGGRGGERERERGGGGGGGPI